MIPTGPQGLNDPYPQRSKTTDIPYLAALALIILIANLPLFFGKTYQDLDAFSGDYFIGLTYSYNHLGDMLRHGWFFLWGSGMGCGEPEQAFYLGGFLYPFMIFFSLFHFPWNQVLFYVFHFELIGIFSFLLSIFLFPIISRSKFPITLKTFFSQSNLTTSFGRAPKPIESPALRKTLTPRSSAS